MSDHIKVDALVKKHDKKHKHKHKDVAKDKSKHKSKHGKRHKKKVISSKIVDDNKEKVAEIKKESEDIKVTDSENKKDNCENIKKHVEMERYKNNDVKKDEDAKKHKHKSMEAKSKKKDEQGKSRPNHKKSKKKHKEEKWKHKDKEDRCKHADKENSNNNAGKTKEKKKHEDKEKSKQRDKVQKVQQEIITESSQKSKDKNIEAHNIEKDNKNQQSDLKRKSEGKLSIRIEEQDGIESETDIEVPSEKMAKLERVYRKRSPMSTSASECGSQRVQDSLFGNTEKSTKPLCNVDSEDETTKLIERVSENKLKKISKGDVSKKTVASSVVKQIVGNRLFDGCDSVSDDELAGQIKSGVVKLEIHSKNHSLIDDEKNKKITVEEKSVETNNNKQTSDSEKMDNRTKDVGETKKGISIDLNPDSVVASVLQVIKKKREEEQIKKKQGCVFDDKDVLAAKESGNKEAEGKTSKIIISDLSTPAVFTAVKEKSSKLEEGECSNDSDEKSSGSASDDELDGDFYCVKDGAFTLKDEESEKKKKKRKKGDKDSERKRSSNKSKRKHQKLSRSRSSTN